MVAAPSVIRERPSLLDIRAEKAERHLFDFMKLMWSVVEPSRPLIAGWHLEAICEHLEAVTNGEIKRLLLNVPPGSSKSLTVGVFWPGWEWGPCDLPHLRHISASYAIGLTLRDNLRCRRVLESPLYRRLWGDRFFLVSDQNAKGKFENDKTGWKLATSVSGLGTGERGDRFNIDDPHKVNEAESDKKREGAIDWFNEVVPTRMNDPDLSAIVVVMQRVHERDVSGEILERELGYEHVCIPMEWDSRRSIPATSIGWVDPRTEDGELMDPQRFPRHVVADLKKTLGPYASAGQLQQLPAPRGGGIIKEDWWQLWGNPLDPDDEKYKKFPHFDFVLVSADTASGEKEENDWWAVTVWGSWVDRSRSRLGAEPSGSRWGNLPSQEGEPKLMLIYAWRAHCEIHEFVQRLGDTCEKYHADRLIVEEKASGKSVVQEIRRLFRGVGWSTIGINPNADGGGDKVARAHSVVNMFEDKVVYAPDKTWAQMVIDEVKVFPRGKNDDLLDTVVQALRYLRKIGIARLSGEQSRKVEHSKQYRRNPPPLYTGR